MADDKQRTEAERQAQAGMEASGGVALARELLAEQRVAVLATVSGGRRRAVHLARAVRRLGPRGPAPAPLRARAAHPEPRRRSARLALRPRRGGGRGRSRGRRPACPRRARRRVTAAEEPDARSRYLARHPEARGLLQLDFALYVLEVEEAQLVGGFASAGWIPGDQLRGPGSA